LTKKYLNAKILRRMEKLKTIDTEEIPQCPYCSKELVDPILRKQAAIDLLRSVYVFFCPYCKKLLPVGM